MDRTGKGFTYLKNKFPAVSDAKIKEGIFVGLQTRELVRDQNFDEELNDTEKALWLSFKKVCTEFLGNH